MNGNKINKDDPDQSSFASSSSQMSNRNTELSSSPIPFSTPPGFLDFNLSKALLFISSQSRFYHQDQVFTFSTALNWVQHDVVTRKKHLPNFLKAMNLKALLQENPKLSNLKVSDGFTLGDDVECMKLILHTLENIVMNHKSCINLRNDEPNESQSVKMEDEINDLTVEDDKQDVNPIIIKTESLQSQEDYNGMDYVNDNNGSSLPQRPGTSKNITNNIQQKLGMNNNDFGITLLYESYESDGSSDNESSGYQSVSSPQTKKLRLARVITPESNYSPSNFENLKTLGMISSNCNLFVLEEKNNQKSKIKAELIPPTTSATISASSSIQPPQTQFKIIYPVVVENQMDLYVYDFETREPPFKMYHIQNLREFSSIVVTASHVYDIGGRDPNSTLTSPDGDDTGTVEAFTTTTIDKNMFIERYDTLKEPRREFGTCVFQDAIYVIGGCQDTEVPDGIIDWVEKLEIERSGKDAHRLRTPKWTPATDHLRTPRASFNASVFDNKIFVVGGIGPDGFPLRSVETFESGKWTSGGNLCQGRGFLKTAVCGSKLYAVGGIASPRFYRAEVVLKSAEVYNPIDDSWSVIEDMKCPRKNFGLIESNGLLFAIGGNTDSTIQSIEFYDPRVGELGQWCLMEWPKFLHQDVDFRSAVLYP